MRITIQSDGAVVVTIPEQLTAKLADRFVTEKREWIEKNIAKIAKRSLKSAGLAIPTGTAKDLKEKKQQALTLVSERLAHFNKIYQFSWNAVAIKNTSTRWGSCSKQRNLNFNYRIVYLPQELADYLVVHELCHLGELNHSNRFWNLVLKTVPNYKELRKKLKSIH